MLTPSGTIYRLYADMLNQGHVLIAGTTGSGKSVVLNGLISTVLYDSPGNKSMVLIDPKQVELAQYKDTPHCIGYADTDFIPLLDRAIATMDARFKEMKSKGLKEWDKGTIYVMIDELSDLVLKSPETLQRLVRIGCVGRAAHIYLIACTQTPNRKVIPAELQVNFASQLALRCRTRIESRQVIQEPGAEKLPLYGKGLYWTPNFLDIQRVTIPKIEDSEIARLIKHWEVWK